MTRHRLIAVDIGNSATKLGWFAKTAVGELPHPHRVVSFPTLSLPPENLAAELPAEACEWHVSSVQREGTRLFGQWVAAERSADSWRVLSFHDLPIRVAVEYPEKVGLDRLAAAVAANVLRESSRPAIVVGAGSAITVNRISADGVFEGGAILPGYKMQADALFGADLLPLALLAPDAAPPLPVGTNTEAAIRSGLFWGAVGAVRELVRQMSAGLTPRPQVFVTGGDLRQLSAHVEDARYFPHLVLTGIAVSAHQPAA